MTLKIRRRHLVVAATLVVLAVGAGIAYAAIPNGGVIHGCYNNNGNLRVIDSPSVTCKNGETSLDWNQTGLPGTNGTNGTDGTNGTNGTNGTDGTNGTNGTNGVSGYEIATGTTTATSSTHGYLNVFCPAGKKALGGGALVTQHLPNVGDFEFLDGVVDGSRPFSDGAGWTFHYNVNNPDGHEIHVTGYATCATMN
jgi:hypothetical protein